jgi:hypothetical protein
VYAVAPGWVTAHRADVTITRPNGRAYGYWHIKPVVRSGRRVRLHQLIGHVLKGWGHVHFAESIGREYRNPLRKGALQPFYDHTPPVVDEIAFVASDGSTLSTARVRGDVDVRAEVYDLPPIAPPSPWEVARLTPAFVWWRLAGVTGWNLAVDFHFALMPATLYNWIYAPGSYQNKAHRPGKYLFWIAHDLDTSSLPDGRYRLEIQAFDTRWNIGTATTDFTVANGELPVLPSIAPGMRLAR